MSRRYEVTARKGGGFVVRRHRGWGCFSIFAALLLLTAAVELVVALFR